MNTSHDHGLRRLLRPRFRVCFHTCSCKLRKDVSPDALMHAGAGASVGLCPFTKMTQASVEALRYRGEDVEKSLTKNTIKEVSLHRYLRFAATILSPYAPSTSQHLCNAVFRGGRPLKGNMKGPECTARHICGIFCSLGRNDGVLPVQARAKELRLELLNSKRLQAHFEEHPADLALLKHDKPLAKTAAASHLKHLPAYLRDAAGMKKTSYSGNKGRGD